MGVEANRMNIEERYGVILGISANVLKHAGNIRRTYKYYEGVMVQNAGVFNESLCRLGERISV